MTEEASKRNPASRLLDILTRAKDGPANVSARLKWCQVFEIADPLTESALFEVQSRLLSLRKLFTDVEESLRSIPGINEELFVAPVSNLAGVIDINNLHSSFANYIGKLSDDDLFALRFGEDLLRKNLETQENEIPSDEIKEILDEINRLYEAILASSLPQELKSELLDLLVEILKSVHEYRVRGASALRDALKKSVGVLATNKQAIEENKDSEEIQALGRMLVRIDTAYSFAMKMKPLLEAAANLFPALAAHIK